MVYYRSTAKENMKLAGLFAVSAFLMHFPVSPGFAEEKTIYGGDDRTDYYAAPVEWRKLADSTVALFDADKVAFNGALTLSAYGEAENLCKTERFYDQPKGPFCSGSLVAPDVVLTAGHCIPDAAGCSHTKFVFGYAIKFAGFTPSRVMPWDVYGCAGIVSHKHDPRAGDYALVRLNRPVYTHVPLKLNRGGDIAAGAAVVAIGYPKGLPLKVIGGAVVRDASKPEIFVSDLDTFSGNSGAPVFNARTRLVEGIFIRGDRDFVRSGDCMVSNVNPQDGGRGEDATKISLILPFVPYHAPGLSAWTPEMVPAGAAPDAQDEELERKAGEVLEAFGGR
jgi:hypothetical protein